VNTTEQSQPKQSYSTPAQRTRRKIAREVAAMYDWIARAAGFEPAERRTAFAISALRYEYDGEDPDKSRRISLVSIGKWLTSRSDDEEACRQVATRHVGQLFNHAIPRTRFQILTRFKSEQGSNKAHEYGHDRLMQAAAFFSELFAEEKQAIFTDKSIEKKERQSRIEEARVRLINEALNYLPPCDTELITPEGEVYAYVSSLEAKAYCKANPDFTSRPYAYTPPPTPEEKKRRPLYSEDFDRIESQIERSIEDRLEEALNRNSFDEARHFATRLLTSIPKRISSWVKTTSAAPRAEERGEAEEHEELYTSNKSDMGGAVENSVEAETPSRNNLLREEGPNSFADNAGENNTIKTDPVENSQSPAPILSGSENFDSALEAALFYARAGWHVLPICQFDYQIDCCTARWHSGDCTGKKPLVKGSGEPGKGYTAATRDPGKIRKWWGGEFQDAGVGIRLDGHALLDCDLKDGGPESYEFLRDTFELPETLTAITQSGGRHYVFKLPEDLPTDWLKSWTRIGNKIALGGIDLKVGVCGLLYAEPTIGSKGVYRWIDPTVEPAILPRKVCDFLHEVRYKDDKPKVEKAKPTRVYSSRPTSPQAPGEVDSNQAKYFRDVAPGESRHRRLYEIGCAIRAATRASAEEIAKAMRYHAACFSAPLHDEAYILRTSAAIAGAF
jgi:hypothetical protein